MIKTLLPNARFLAIKSEHWGRDWSDCVHKLDSQLDALGMDLASETIYLIFDRSPGAILAQEGEVLVARPVIGPKKSLTPPFELVDWNQALVFKKRLGSLDWGKILEECRDEWESLQRENLAVKGPFLLEFRKLLGPQLELELSVLFSE